MKLITRDTDYAIRALGYIAGRKEKIITVSELVRVLKMPRPFLRKILQILHKNGILNSYRGLGGGFSLKKTPKEILIIDLIKIFQGPLSINECVFRKKICPNRKTCLLSKKINQIEKSVYTQFKGMSIADLA